MSRRGNCHDNAVAESFFNLLKRERIRRRVYRSRDETKTRQERDAVARRVRKAAEALAGPSPAVPYSRAWLKGASSGATGPPTSMDEPSQTTIWGVRIVGSPDYSFSESVA